jgi:hypothetical protein
LIFPPCCLKKPNQLTSGRAGLPGDFHRDAFLQTVFNVRREKKPMPHVISMVMFRCGQHSSDTQDHSSHTHAMARDILSTIHHYGYR